MTTTVLITGHRGFIGRHLLAECARRGYTVTGVDTADPAFPDDCRRFFAHNTARFDLVFHCAATIGGRVGIDHNPLGVATNLALDADLFQWALRTRPGRVVYFSSSAAYPVHLQGEFAPSTRLSEWQVELGTDVLGRPDGTYGWAKLTGEMLAEHVNDAGVPVHVFRPFSGYGADQDGDYPFRAFLDRARRREDPFEVWGTGAQVRDFIHVDDVVGAVFAAIEQDVRGPVNLCTGIGTSFNELAELVTSAAGYSPTIRHVQDAPTGVDYRVGDPTAMRRFYQPKVTLEDAVRAALKVDGGVHGEKTAARQ
jgi:nucleoside-diphosphate-sugar epimerase